MTEFPWMLIVLIAIPALGGAILLRAVSKPLGRHERLFAAIRLFLIILYVLIIVYATLFTRSTGHSFKLLISPFWSYRRAFALTGNGLFFGLTVTDSRILKLIILNILLYVPFGYLLPFAWPGLLKIGLFASRPRLQRLFRAFPWIVVLLGTVMSISTEFAQLIFRLGFFEFDDIFNNTLGCLIGVVLYLVLLRPKPATGE